VTTTRTLDVLGLPVRLAEGGSGPAVLLLHGSGPGTTGSGAWGTTIEALEGSWHLVAPDHAGFGGSALAPGSRGGLQVWTEQAAALLDALGIESCAVVGHSMGGAVALALAAARPHQVTHVVAVSTMGAPGAPLSDALDALWAAPPGEAGARDMLSRLLLDQALVTPAAVEARATAMTAGAAAFERLFRPPRERWVEDLTLSPRMLGAVRAPVLLVHGADDQVTPIAPSALPLLDLLADVRLHVLGHCGHVPSLEHPEEFRRVVSAFLRHGPRSGVTARDS
jgi:2-hydroxymuconate-semialdehyde hydrolase